MNAFLTTDKNDVPILSRLIILAYERRDSKSSRHTLVHNKRAGLVNKPDFDHTLTNFNE